MDVPLTRSFVGPTVGELKPEITPVTFCPWLDFNVNSQLGRFGLHNGGDDDEGLLNEKWEGLALVPVTSDENDGKNGGKEYYLFASSDNDFMTQGGELNPPCRRLVKIKKLTVLNRLHERRPVAL